MKNHFISASSRVNLHFLINRMFVITALASGAAFLLEMLIPGFVAFSIPLAVLLLPFILATFAVILSQ